MPSAFRDLGGWGDEAVRHRANAFDVAANDLAWAKEPGWLAGSTNAGGGAGKDQVAREEGEHRGTSCDEFGHAEDHLRGTTLLDFAVIDAATEFKVVRICEFIGCHEPRAGGP